MDYRTATIEAYDIGVRAHGREGAERDIGSYREDPAWADVCAPLGEAHAARLADDGWGGAVYADIVEARKTT